MRTLIIYDATGFIISIMSGDVREPVGVPFMWVEIPTGKYVVSIDVTGEEPAAVYGEHPKSELQLMQERQAETEAEVDFRLSMIELGLI